MIAARNISIRTKLTFGFGLALALIVAVGVFGLFQSHTLNRHTAEITRIWLPRIELLGEIKRAMGEHRLFAIRRTETSDFHQLAVIAEKLASLSADLHRQWTVYEETVDTAEEKVFLSQLVALWGTYERSLAAVIDRFDAGGFREALQAFEAVTLVAFDDASARLANLIALSRQRSEQIAGRSQAIYSNLSMISLALIGFCVLCIVGAVVWATRNISRPLLRVSQAMGRLTGGDESVTISEDCGRKDEIGALATAVAGYREALVRGRDLAGEAERERQRLDAAISHMPIGLVMFDKDRRLIIANPRYAEMYGLPPHLAKPGTPLQAILEHRVSTHGTEPDNYVEYLETMIDHGVPFKDLITFRDGRIFSLVYQPMEGGGWVSTHEDVTDRRKAEAQLAFLSRHDALTGLPNRLFVREQITSMLAKAQPGRLAAILCLDLDHFKQVNDTLGHTLGDKLLVAVAERLSRCVREEDVVARLGGDEFAVIQVGAEQPQGARTLAQRIVDSLSPPYVIDGHQSVIGVSVGIVIAPVDGNNADRLLKHGDIALYRAKAEGRGTFRFFEPEMDARMQARRTLELDLRQAVVRGEFEVYYQPQFNLATDRVSGFEALVRWRHPRRGLVEPGDFIGLAEETGLIVEIGETVIREACIAAAAWPAPIKVAVNLSAVQFRSARLTHAVVDALAVSGLAANRLELEITESVLLAPNEATMSLLHQVRQLGVRIAMDDFGTGYSSLSYLQSFPFDKIKIDQRFTKAVATDNNAVAIIRAVTGLSASLGIETTAEGVETTEQLDRVRAEGCTEAQGFLIGRPMPLKDVERLIGGPRGLSIAAA